MIAGRSTNLWLGAASTIWGVLVAVLHVDPTLAGLVLVALGAVITLIAGQPPTVSPGDKVTVQTASGQPNYQTTIAEPPKQDPPPEPLP